MAYHSVLHAVAVQDLCSAIRMARILETGSRCCCATRQVQGHRVQIVGMAKEQHGCRYLQRLITGESAARAQIVVDEILPETGALMTDPFGNYLIQKVLDTCSTPQRGALLEAACAAGLCRIARDTHGTRSVQKLVEAVCSLLPHCCRARSTRVTAADERHPHARQLPH